MSKIARYISPAPPRLVNDKSKNLKNKKLKNLIGNKRKKFFFGDFILDTLWVSILAHPVVECHSSNFNFLLSTTYDRLILSARSTLHA